MKHKCLSQAKIPLTTEVCIKVDNKYTHFIYLLNVLFVYFMLHHSQLVCDVEKAGGSAEYPMLDDDSHEH